MISHLPIALSLACVQLFITAALLSMPHVTHRDLLFGVPVPPGFRSTEAGRKALAAFRVWIAIPAALNLLALCLFPASPINIAGSLATGAVGMTAFVVLNRKLKPFAIQPPQARQTTLEPLEPLPWFVWLGIGPLVMLAGAAAYLHAHWDQIPLRYPVHFNLNGIPDRWANRGFASVYGILIFAGELALVLFGMLLAGWYGSRRSDWMRKPALVVMLSAEWVVALMFALIPIQTAAGFRVPIPVMVLAPLILLIPALAYSYRESIKPRDPIDPTPNECWKGGILYYNPNDAALFVQRRDGMGFTVNFGNRWSWAIYGALLLVILSGPLVMHVRPN